MDDDLADFVGTRLNEDEAYARNAFGDHNEAGPHWYEQWSGALNIGEDEDLVLTNDSAVSRFMERNDPERVLTEVEAKRQTLAGLVTEGHASLSPGGSTEIYCDADYGQGAPCTCGRDERVERHLRLLALPYAAHPDYRAEWRP